MNIKELENELLSYGVENPKSEATIILQELFGVSPSELILNKNKDFSSKKLSSVLNGRKERIPLQHLLGKWDFMGLSFYVSKDCLIPRSDTEILVEKAISVLKKGDTVVDLCTGSGCIGLSILKYMPDIKSLTLVDLSEKALLMAEKNAKALGLMDKCSLRLSDITKDVPNDKYDLITANPPYIPTKDIEFLSPEVKKEPFMALDGGFDGLDIIRALANKWLDRLNDGGTMLIEFGYDQKEQIQAIFKEKLDTGSINELQILYDYGSNPRVLLVRK